MKVYKQRVYCITLRSLSAIQKGIQSAHALAEYAYKFGCSTEYKQWVRKDKTLVVLQCSTSSALKSIIKQLKKHNIKVQEFSEPDLDGIITSICFMADERAYAKNIDINTTEALVIRNIIEKLELAQ